MTTHIPGRRMLAAALATAGLATCWAGAARADSRIAGTDDVTITAPNVDFGDAGFNGRSPTGPAKLQWLLRDGLPQPEVAGTIHIDKARFDCAYIELVSVNSVGDPISTVNSPTLCADDQDHHTLTVDVRGPAEVDTVGAIVNLHFVTGIGDTVAGAAGANFGPFAHDVQIDEQGVDFGTAFADDHVTSPGNLDYYYFSFSTRVTLTGVMHLKGVAGLCSRMQLEYLDVLGNVVGSADSRKTCAPDGGIKKAKVKLDDDIAPTAVTARVELQTLGNDQKWHTAGSQDVGLSDPFVSFEY